jgi:membrane-associated phospholipid phosphatase
VNQYAAFPSLHFGWNLLVAIAVIAQVRRLGVRMLAMFMPAAMLVSIVLTANHFWIDAVAGGVVALIGLGVALYWNRREPAAAELKSWIFVNRLEERTAKFRDLPVPLHAPDTLTRTADGA